MSEAYSTEPDTTQEDSQLQLHSQHGRSYTTTLYCETKIVQQITVYLKTIACIITGRELQR